MVNLNASQIAALRAVSDASETFQIARETLERRIREACAAELDALRVKRDVAAFHAFQAGVPKSRIGREGLGSKAPLTTSEAIENGRRYAVTPAAPDTPTEAPAPAPVPTPFALGDHPGTYTYTAPDDDRHAPGESVTFARSGAGLDITTDDYAAPVVTSFFERSTQDAALSWLASIGA